MESGWSKYEDADAFAGDNAEYRKTSDVELCDCFRFVCDRRIAVVLEVPECLHVIETKLKLSCQQVCTSKGYAGFVLFRKYVTSSIILYYDNLQAYCTVLFVLL